MSDQPNSQSHASTKPLDDRFEALDNSLMALVEAVNQVRNELTTLQQPSVETVSQPESVVTESVEEPTTMPEKEQEANIGDSVVSPQAQAFLEAVNTLSIPELTDKLKSTKAKKNVLKNIIAERKKLNFQAFSSLEDLIARTKGLAQHSLEKIMILWS
jgi:predicted nucleic acid-binding OB-fold protein